MKKRVSAKLLAVMMLLCVMCMSIFVTAKAEPADEAVPELEITVADFAANATLGMGAVGTYENGKLALNEAYSDLDIDLSKLGEASVDQAAAEKLAAAVDRSSLTVGMIDAEGKATFKGLTSASTLYVVLQLSGEEIVKISPMLVVLPFENEDGITNSVKIQAKFERVVEEKGAVILNKQGDDKKPLAGAEFTFEVKRYIEEEATAKAGAEKDDKGSYVWEAYREDVVLVTDKNGQIVVDELPMGSYRFIETKAPAGYVLDSTPVPVEINKSGSVKLENGVYVADEGEPVILTVLNKPVPEEPSKPESSKPTPTPPPYVTGEDIVKFIIVGVVVGVSLVAVILLFVLGKKKKDDTDDDE